MKHITIEQRYQIEAYLKLKVSKEIIAKELNIDRSSVFREIKRNKLKNGVYSAKKLTNIPLIERTDFLLTEILPMRVKTLLLALLKMIGLQNKLLGIV